MPEFDENTNFQLPGLGSAEKDSPGSFRDGTPLFRVNGDPDPDEIIIEGVSGDSSAPILVEEEGKMQPTQEKQPTQEMQPMQETARADAFTDQPAKPSTQISQELTDLKESTARADAFNEAKKVFEAKEQQYNADLANRMRDAGGANITRRHGKLPASVQGIANTAAREGAEGAGKGLGSRMLDGLISSGKSFLNTALARPSAIIGKR